ncbi:hypothetical protein N7540_002714 [Penicillium herquei]|nr:hypothetical protein N7540_002714 [Penicillium herquei]
MAVQLNAKPLSASMDQEGLRPSFFGLTPKSSVNAPITLESMEGEAMFETRNAKPTKIPLQLPVKLDPSTKTVLVVGAGISGLRAASVLKKHGLNVVVLEARDRIGGRINTSRKEGKPARDIGA